MVLMDAISSIIAAYIGYKLDMDWCLCSGANNKCEVNCLWIQKY